MLKQKIFILVLLVSNLTAQDEINQFENISTLSGLSASQAKCIFQDLDGYLWIGTMGGGLNRYDGYSFTVYKNNQDDSTSLGHDNVYSLAEDENGYIWIATGNGVSKYIKGEDKFINYNFREQFEELSDINFHSTYEIFVDSKFRIWVGDSYHGALLYNKDEDIFEPVPQQSEKSIDSLPQVYGDINEDMSGKIWASGGTSGLFWFDENKNIFRSAEMNAKNWNLLKSKEIFRISPDLENNIWIMTRTDLYKYLTSSQELFHHMNYEVHNPINGGYEGELIQDSEGNMLVVHINLPNPIKFIKLSNEFVTLNSEEMSPTDIFEDSFGNVWVTDWSRGIYKLVPTKQNFLQIKKDTQNLWGNSRISAIYQSELQPELLFVSAAEYGRSNLNNLKSYNWKTSQINNYNISDVSEMIANDDGTYWIGIWDDGLKKWNPVTGELEPHFRDSTKNPNLHNTSILNLRRDARGSIWIGTLNGLYFLSPDGLDLKLIIGKHAITAIYMDEDILWIGTYNAGLFKYNLRTNNIEEFRYEKTSNSLSNDIVWDIHRDKEGFLWLATAGGLNRFDLRTNEFKVYTESDGLESSYIAALLPGEYGSIWMATSSGLSRLHKDSKNRISFSNYNAMDGVINPNFQHPIKLKDSQGRLFFGGTKGLYYFTPQKRKSKPPIIHITDLMINGKSAINSDIINFSQLRNGEIDLALDHDQNTISIEFIALHFAQPSQNKYSYYLEGYESGWQYAKQRDVQYVNLDPGLYNFHLRAANRDGIWSSKEIIFPIRISKPWWDTWYAYSVYFLIFLGSLVAVRKFELNRRNELESKKLLEAENIRKSEELEEARKLQLSMLPRDIPQIPNLDISVYMKTATEVGGDYYDFHIGLDGTFTAVVGDATGHGMRAGTMVTSTKSLFSSYAEHEDIINTFQEMTRCIKTMNLENLSMCMTMIKINGDRLRMSAAGMPPVYIYRKNTSSVEEYLFEGMPLGTMRDFPYEVRETTINPGDTILLMSDGFPELSNNDDEMLGFKRTKHLFEESGLEIPEDIINKLKISGLEWINGKDPNDDVTFVVIKVK